MNAVVVSGRLATEVDFRYTAHGRPVCSFIVAFSQPHAVGFVRVSAFDELADVAKRCKKGDAVEVVGRVNFEATGAIERRLAIIARSLKSSLRAEDLAVDFRRGRAASDPRAPLFRPNLQRGRKNAR